MKKIILLFICFLYFNSFAQTIGLQSFASGFSSPVEIIHPPNDARLFIVQKGGLIRIVNPNGTTNATPFLTVTGLSNGGEQGLLGLAFHPNYATNGLFFINYTNTAGDTVIARYSVSSNPDIANATGTILMTIDQPYSNHNGGTLRFGPDGYLYIGMGDGGSGDDPQGFAQNMTIDPSFPSRIFLGKMLRIDVDSGTLYGIPPTNPYIGQAGKEEIWAIGLRNPWKFSFNRLNGDLWIADVGQNEIEEINKVAAPLPNTGLNFGWRCYEGNAAYITSGCAPSNTMTFPISQYTHASGRCSITGGFFYTGTTYPDLQNKYVFADYCTGEVGYVNDSNEVVWSFDSSNVITTFGEGLNGELYVFNGGSLFRVIDTSLNTSSYDKMSISIYPNPAKSILNIKNNSTSFLNKIRIHDVTGKTIIKRDINNSQISSIEVSEIAAGIYIISAEDNLGNVVKTKFIKE
ncbi:PQQ-dependent sugar dehydrogenase [Flavobacterium dankookense]|uniref:Putative secreted protein (Por secretion system target) n=1 Tax=Flavobacterium dankookense TaxID=706186 RepID=A0A4R6QAE0_9FLAO|nr:PQQ-dependent sugar dehydrogenase [Flavobacterium dankookense]TDP58876.1 putative secreted protein (Por secretion system target) [Flavobacterium dankookense]